jgi:hypothetical protein
LREGESRVMLRPDPKVVTLRHVDYDGRDARGNMLVGRDQEEKRRRIGE